MQIRSADRYPSPGFGELTFPRLSPDKLGLSDFNSKLLELLYNFIDLATATLWVAEI